MGTQKCQNIILFTVGQRVKICGLLYKICKGYELLFKPCAYLPNISIDLLPHVKQMLLLKLTLALDATS